MGRSYEGKKKKKTQESRIGGVIAQTVTRNNISEDRFTLRAPVPRERGEGDGVQGRRTTNDSPSARRASVTLDFVIDWP